MNVNENMKGFLNGNGNENAHGYVIRNWNVNVNVIGNVNMRVI